MSNEDFNRLYDECMKNIEANKLATNNPELDRLFANAHIIIKKLGDLTPIGLNEVECVTAFINIDQMGVLLEVLHARFKKHTPKEVFFQWRGIVNQEDF